MHICISQITPDQLEEDAAAAAAAADDDEPGLRPARGRRAQAGNLFDTELRVRRRPEPASGSGSGSGSGDGESGRFEPRVPHCSKALLAVFTGQYVIGLAYIVVAFVKHAEVSYYHLRVILGLCSITLAVGVVSEYTRRVLACAYTLIV